MTKPHSDIAIVPRRDIEDISINLEPRSKCHTAMLSKTTHLGIVLHRMLYHFNVITRDQS